MTVAFIHSPSTPSGHCRGSGKTKVVEQTPATELRRPGAQGSHALMLRVRYMIRLLVGIV
jgi:hypothetical protein